MAMVPHHLINNMFNDNWLNLIKKTNWLSIFKAIQTKWVGGRDSNSSVNTENTRIRPSGTHEELSMNYNILYYTYM